ncbi:hypothetical protein PLCT2_02968 [Planctomycetaceae bacterium]|nr:hypothetical protein PLCT2_02968 [Planctomycetaceae bacterium]
MKFRKNSLTRMRAKSPVRGKHAKGPENQEFYFFEPDGLVSCNGSTILFAPNLGGEKTSRELVGKALHTKDARRIAKELPKGRMANDAGLEVTAEKGNLFLRDAKGVMHQAPLADRSAPDWRKGLPAHNDYYEVAVNPRELRGALMSVEQLSKDRLPTSRGAAPSVTLRVSHNSEHPLELHSPGGVFGAVLPQSKNLIVHCLGRISRWFHKLVAPTETSTTKAAPAREYAKAA